MADLNDAGLRAAAVVIGGIDWESCLPFAKSIVSAYLAVLPPMEQPSAAAVAWFKQDISDISGEPYTTYAAEILRFVEGRDNG